MTIKPSSCINLRKQTSALSESELEAAHLLLQLCQQRRARSDDDGSEKTARGDDHDQSSMASSSSSLSPAAVVDSDEEEEKEDRKISLYLDLRCPSARKRRRFRSLVSLYASSAELQGQGNEKNEKLQLNVTASF